MRPPFITIQVETVTVIRSLERRGVTLGNGKDALDTAVAQIGKNVIGVRGDVANLAGQISRRVGIPVADARPLRD
jgi:hypothetical protein